MSVRVKALGTLCAPILVIGLAIGGCSRSRGDQSITTDIQARMFSDSQTKSANVTVAAKNGIVTLSGEVPDESTRYEAFKIASETPGVSKVNDEMSMQQAQNEANAQASQTDEQARTSAAAPDRTGPAERGATAEHSAPVHRPLSTDVKPHSRTHRDSLDSRETTQTGNYQDDRSTYQADQARQADQPARADQLDQAYQSDRADQAPPASSAPPTTPAPDAAAPAPQIQQQQAAPPPPAAPEPRRVELPAGTAIRIQMIDAVDSSVNHAGQDFHASLAAPIVLNGDVVVPAGTDIFVTLVNASSAGKMKGKSELSLELDRLEYQGKTYVLSSSKYGQEGKSRGTRTAKAVGGGAVLGAILGAAIGRGTGAAIGAGVGAAGGAAAEAAGHGEQVRIPSETKLDFTLAQPVMIGYYPDRNRPRR